MFNSILKFIIHLSPIYINTMFTIYLIKIVWEFWVRACFVWVRKLNIAGLPKVQGNSFTKLKPNKLNLMDFSVDE